MVKAVVYEAQGGEVSERKKNNWEVVTVLRNLTSSC